MLVSKRIKPVTPVNLLFALLCVVGVAIAEEALSIEFLDYLAEFEAGEEEWIDPVELEMMAQLGSAHEERDSDMEELENAR